MEKNDLCSVVESLLFVSGEPVSYARLAQTLSVPEKAVATALTALQEKYQTDATSGLMLICHEETALLATKPGSAVFVETLTKSTLQETLSKAALEVLAIVVYRAPISRGEIDAIRGVNCSFTLRNLLLRDLITRVGNPSDSRGYLYRPTLLFLETLGIGQIGELPDYETLSQDERLQMILAGEDKLVTTKEDEDTKKVTQE